MDKANICIVDDSYEVTELLEDYLEVSDLDCTIHTFNQPTEAINYLREHQDVDILITDYHMGKYTGLDVIRATPKEALKIVISGDINRDELRTLRKVGVTYHDKPISMKEIETDIREFTPPDEMAKGA